MSPSTKGTARRYLAAGSAVAVAAAVLYPPLWALGSQGSGAIFAHFAADSFYYLTIAKNAVTGLLSSFDGTTLTNGYHPLWQMALVAMFRAIGPDLPAQLLGAYLACAALVAAGLALFAIALRRLTGSALAGLWLVPGAFHLAFSVHSARSVDPGLTYTHSAWALVNGMETPLSIFFVGLLLAILTGKTRNPLVPGVIAALAVLARLDDVFLPVALAVWLLQGPEPRADRIRRAVLFAAPTVVVVGAYLLANRLVFGIAFPVSAAVKGGWAMPGNFEVILSDLLPPLHLLIAPDYDLEGWIYSAQRTVLLVVPAVASALALASLPRERTAPGQRIPGLAPLAPFLLYVILKASWNLLRVDIDQQGYWYHSVPLVLFNCLVIVVVRHLVTGVPAAQRLRVALATAWTLVYLVSAANAIHRTTGPNWWHDVWRHRETLRAELLARRPHARVVDFYDGLFAYCLDVPAVPVTALATDAAGLEAFRAGRYAEYCLARGHDIAVWSSRSYPLSRSWLRLGEPSELFRDPETGVTFTELR